MKTFRITTTIMVSDEAYKKEVQELKEQIKSGEFQKEIKDSDKIVDCRVSFEDLAYNLGRLK